MKKNLFVLFSFAAIVCACTKELPESNNAVSGDETSTTIISGEGLVVGIDSPVEVKTSTDASMNVIWDETDDIVVFGSNQSTVYSFYSYVDETDKTKAIFKSTGGAEQSVLYAMTPSSAFENGYYNESEGTVKVRMGSISEVSMPKGVNDILASKNITGLPMVASLKDGELSFRNTCGGFMFRPYDYQGLVKVQKIRVESLGGEAIGGLATVNLTTGEITELEGTSTSITMTCADETIGTHNYLPRDEDEFNNRLKGFIVFLPAGTYSQGLKITLVDHMQRAFPIKTGPITIEAGVVQKMAPLPLTIAYGSANCVRVAPGTTSVDIDVTPMYSYGDSYAYGSFHKIHPLGKSQLSHYGNTAKIIWEQKGVDQTNGIISGTPTVTFDDSQAEGATYTATMHVNLTGEAGNALVAISYNGGTIAWSYHIWVSDANEVAVDSYTFLDRNIGAVSVEPGNTLSYGCNYQWGRKDPLRRVLTAPNSDSYQNGDVEEAVNRDIVQADIAWAIKNPHLRVGYTQSCRWFHRGRNSALWGNKNDYDNSGNAKNATTIKTVYDPCPAGYKVATYAALTTLAGKTATPEPGKGYTFTELNNLYLPYAGIVDSGKMTDAFIYQGYRGYLWSSISRSASQGAYILWFNKDGINKNNNRNLANIYQYLGDAMPVRCIKE